MEEELHTQRFMDFQAFKIAHVELPKETKRVERAHGHIGDLRTELTELCHENEQLQIKLQGQDKDISCHSETIRKYSEVIIKLKERSTQLSTKNTENTTEIARLNKQIKKLSRSLSTEQFKLRSLGVPVSDGGVGRPTMKPTLHDKAHHNCNRAITQLQGQLEAQTKKSKRFYDAMRATKVCLTPTLTLTPTLLLIPTLTPTLVRVQSPMTFTHVLDLHCDGHNAGLRPLLFDCDSMKARLARLTAGAPLSPTQGQ